MSLFGAMSTAISGLNAQASAFGNISDNMANSQTVGFKEIGTSFADYLTTSTATDNQSGSVATRPDYLNDVQGTIQQSSDPLALAISGQGFFAVAEQSGSTTGGAPVFNPQQFYTRTGDFTRDSNGYLQNSAGEFLQGWAVNPATGVLDTSALVPIQVAQSQYAPVPTANVTLQANIPATPSAGSSLSSQIQVFDATGSPHELTTAWAQTSPNNWTLTVSSPDNVGGATIGTIGVTFNANGTLASLSSPTGALAVSGSATQAQLALAPNFGSGSQPINLDLGNYNALSGITQYAGTNYAVTSETQDGVAPGSFTGIAESATGDISATFDNGQSVRIARVPLITFEDADALQRQDGQAFTATASSGAAAVQNVHQNGAGGLVVGSTESSNVDIASQLSTLIVAQQAYGANAKVITAANELLTTTLNMKQ